MNSEEGKTNEDREEEEKDIKEEVIKPISKSPLDSFFKLSMAISKLLISLSITYYFLFFLPSREKTRTANLEKCLTTVNSDYEKAWDHNCKQLLQQIPLSLLQVDPIHPPKTSGCFIQWLRPKKQAISVVRLAGRP